MKILKRTAKIIGIMIGVIVILLATSAIYNNIALKLEESKIKPVGQMVDVGGYKVHVYTEGENSDSPTLVLLSGSATVAPMYDFKSIYSLLSDKYRIAVVEKAGYGYSDIIDISRDVDTMVEELRTALSGADIHYPYILLPHSMSGLESIYWAQKYPEEIAAIVGLDMSVPYSYDEFDFSKINKMMYLGSMTSKLGLIRIPGVYMLNTATLTNDEKYQQRLLMRRNAVNSVYIKEGQAVYENSRTVLNGGVISCPILMFSSNGKEIGDFWLPAQERFAKENNAQLEIFDCGHYIHYYKSEVMEEIIKDFIKSIE
jgi:pimeloyl-ACP methyl ester carboxylesterase